MILLDKMLATGRLIDAEEIFEGARAEVDRCGMGDDIEDYGACFDPDCEYEEQYDAEEEARWCIERLDRGRVERWVEGVDEEADAEAKTEDPDVDEWNAGAVEFNESESVVDREEGWQIARWADGCEALRENFAVDRWMAGDFWVEGEGPITRRHSWGGVMIRE